MEILTYKMIDRICDYEKDVSSDGVHSDSDSHFVRDLGMLCLSSGVLIDDLVDLTSDANKTRTSDWKLFLDVTNELLKFCVKSNIRSVKIYLLNDEYTALHFKLGGFDLEKKLQESSADLGECAEILKSFELFEIKSGGSVNVVSSIEKVCGTVTHINLSLRN